MLVRVGEIEVEVRGSVMREDARWTSPQRRGESLGRVLTSFPRMRVRLDEAPSAELRALHGDHDEAEIDGETFRRVRIRVQPSPAVLVIEWDPS